MGEQLNLDGVFINSIVGEGAKFKGDVSLSGLFRVDGDFQGSIKKADKVLIGRNGRAQCAIHAGTVVVGGVVKGDIVSTKKVVILSTGMVIGNISAPRLMVEDGVVLNGRCRILDFQHKPEDSRRNEEASDQKRKYDIDRYNPLSKFS
mgnify:CR=1 FL=1